MCLSQIFPAQAEMRQRIFWLEPAKIFNEQGLLATVYCLKLMSQNISTREQNGTLSPSREI